MTALEIVARIQEQGHTIRLNGEKVRVEPQLTADLRELLVEYKLEIVALLRSEPCPVQRDDGSWRTVHFDAHIEVDSGYYSAPPTSRSGKTAGRFTVESVPDARVSASSETSTAPRFAAAASTVTRQAKAPIEQRLLAILTAGGPRHGYSRSVLHLTFAGAGKGKLIRARRLLTARGLAVERRESRPNIPAPVLPVRYGGRCPRSRVPRNRARLLREEGRA